MTRNEAVKYIRYCMCEGRLIGNTKSIFDEKWQAGVMAIDALEQKIDHWIPVKFRPLTDEEQEEYPDYCYMADCLMMEKRYLLALNMAELKKMSADLIMDIILIVGTIGKRI